ncbi:MAG: flavodoxin family protein [Lachnospiraceae bacterium]|nr:flavodoxin family protein [Lachnospiraceae bacterium]
MKILIINGSPKSKQSNSYKLATSFVNGITKVWNAEINEVDLSSVNIQPCSGCFACWGPMAGQCVIDDDMKNVMNLILESDIIVWSFGLYFYNVPGKLKCLIDRQLPFSMPFMDSGSEHGSHKSRYDMTGKRNVVISTCGFHTANGNYDSVDAMFNHIFVENNYERIYCPQGELFRVEQLAFRTDEYLKNLELAGSEFATCGISDETRAKINEPLFPREQYEAMANGSWG